MRQNLTRKNYPALPGPYSWGALTKLAMVLVGLPPPAF